MASPLFDAVSARYQKMTNPVDQPADPMDETAPSMLDPSQDAIEPEASPLDFIPYGGLAQGAVGLGKAAMEDAPSILGNEAGEVEFKPLEEAAPKALEKLSSKLLDTQDKMIDSSDLANKLDDAEDEHLAIGSMINKGGEIPPGLDPSTYENSLQNADLASKNHRNASQLSAALRNRMSGLQKLRRNIDIIPGGKE